MGLFCFASSRWKSPKSPAPSAGSAELGHGLGRSYRDLPPALAAQLAASVSDLEDCLRVLAALYIPTRYPNSLPEGAPTDHFGCLQSSVAISLPVRSLMQSVWRWPAPEQVLQEVHAWARQEHQRVPSLYKGRCVRELWPWVGCLW